jgi:hypothetical protein
MNFLNLSIFFNLRFVVSESKWNLSDAPNYIFGTFQSSLQYNFLLLICTFVCVRVQLRWVATAKPAKWNGSITRVWV